MATRETGLAELSVTEQKQLGSRHPEIRHGESALVIAAPRPILSAIRDYARQIIWEEEQKERLLEVMSQDVEIGVLDEQRVVQLHRQTEARERFLQEFPILSSHEVADLGGSTASNASAMASRWKKAGKIFALPIGRGDRYPAFQFADDGKPLPVISEVIGLFGARSAWSLALWFASSSGWLHGKRPVDMLETHPEEVVQAARRTVEPLEF